MASSCTKEVKYLTVTQRRCNNGWVYCVQDRDQGHCSDPRIMKTIQELITVVETGTYPASLDGLDRNEAQGINGCPHMSIYIEPFSVMNDDDDDDKFAYISPRTRPIVSLRGSVGETVPGPMQVVVKRDYLLSGNWLIFARTRIVFYSAHAEHDLLEYFFSSLDPKAANIWRDKFAPEYKSFNCEFILVRKLSL